MNRTNIEWVRNPDGKQGFTVNPIRFRNLGTGKVGHYCEKLSAGCTNCYASRMQTGPYLSGLEFIAENKSKGELYFDDAVIEQVLRRRKPATIFWCDMTDLFGEWVPQKWQIQCLSVMILTPQHRHIVLTKRSDKMRGFLSTMTSPFYDCLVSSIIAGVSVEDRDHLDRLDHLRQTPAAFRMLSAEPLLADLETINLEGIEWVICGGESGPGARPCHPNWVRSLRDQCQGARVPFFFKQWGRWLHESQFGADSDKPTVGDAGCGEWYAWPDGTHLYSIGKKSAGRLLDGRVWDELPEVLK